MGMQRRSVALLGAAVLVAAVGLAGAGENVFFERAAEKGRTWDLSELADGETRVFGTGEDRIEAIRSGDEVRLTGLRDNRVPEIVCHLGRDTCKVIELEDGGRTMILVDGSGSCDGTDDCHHVETRHFKIGVGDPGDATFIWRGSGCEDGEDCDALRLHELDHDFRTSGGVFRLHRPDCAEDDEDCEPHGEMTLIEGEPGMLGGIFRLDAADCPEDDEDCVATRIHTLGAGDAFRILMRPEGTVLRCPEGDTTMSVKPEEAEDVFLCPKHSVPLEKAKPTTKSRQMRWIGSPHEH